MYNYAGAPAKTQLQVRQILKLYSNRPDGICGNDDCGQRSSWFVLSSMGIYPVNPDSGKYDILSLLFDKADIAYDDKKFVIETLNPRSKYPVIQSMSLNSKPHIPFQIDHSNIIKGGKLTIKLANRN